MWKRWKKSLEQEKTKEGGRTDREAARRRREGNWDLEQEQWNCDMAMDMDMMAKRF